MVARHTRHLLDFENDGAIMPSYSERAFMFAFSQARLKATLRRT